jgi:hypothetical protein
MNSSWTLPGFSGLSRRDFSTLFSTEVLTFASDIRSLTGKIQARIRVE